MIFRSLRPTRLCVLWLIAVSTLFLTGEVLQHLHRLSPAISNTLQEGFIAVLCITLALLLIELFTVYRAPRIRIERDVDHTVAAERITPVTLRFYRQEKQTPYRTPLHFRCHDHHPQPAISTDLPLSVSLPCNKMAKLQYTLQLLERGDALFSGIDLQHRGWFSLLEAVHFYPLETCVRVFPDFSRMDYQGLLTEDYWSQQLGIRKRQRRGEGMEFHQLREYRIGDTQRQIDWKASGRRRQLISREYQEERDQNVLFLLDAGQAMRAQEGELTHFDHALNSLMLLAHIALKTGDSVSFMSMGSERERYFAAQKGMDAINNLLNAVYDLHATAQATDYLDAAMRLMQRNPRRSLVILLTNITDAVPDELLSAVRLLRQRHVLLIANLQEATLPEALRKPVDDFDSAVSFAVAADIAEQRQNFTAELHRLGVRAFDAAPESLSPLLVNRYLDIKRAGVL